MKLYKYCDENSVDILKYKRLLISKIDEFNDPFEFKLAVGTDITHETVLENIADEKTAEKVYNLFLEENLCQEMGHSDFIAWFKQYGKQYFHVLQDSFGPGIKVASENLYNKMARDYRVICLSACPDSILMWSHYGKQHQGILFKFETEYLVREKALHDIVIQEVKYEFERVKLPARLDHRNDEASRQILASLLQTKYVDWKYEREYRIMVEFDHSENYPYINVDAKAIEEVVLGMKCDWKTEALVKELLRRPEYNHVILKRTKIHSDQFSLIYEPVS